MSDATNRNDETKNASSDATNTTNQESDLKKNNNENKENKLVNDEKNETDKPQKKRASKKKTETSTDKKEGSTKRTFDQYQVPEYIYVEVTDPITHQVNGKNSYTTYKITVNTTLPEYKQKEFSVRRRYSDFVWLRNHLKEKLDEKGKRLTIPELPGNTFGSLFGSGRFDPAFIEERRKGLETFLNSVVNHPWARFEEGLHKFLEEQDFPCRD
jgi:sorting nexin-3/12